jgi:hypothetical protein
MQTMPARLAGLPHAQECLQAWRNEYNPPEKKRERDAFCDRLKKGSPKTRQGIYRDLCNISPSSIAEFRPMLNRECDIFEANPGPMRSPSTLKSARPASSRSPSPTASSASSRSAPEVYDIGDCDEYRDARACNDVDKCVWKKDRCLPRSAMHAAMDAGEGPSRASLRAIMGLAGAASAAGVAASRPGAAAFGGPGGLALKPRADTAAKHPLPASSLLRRHKQLERLLEDKQQGLFDPTKFVYLGSADSGTRVCVTYHTSKIKTFEDAQKNKVIIGASAAGGSTRDKTLEVVDTIRSDYGLEAMAHFTCVAATVAELRSTLDGLTELARDKALHPDVRAAARRLARAVLPHP